MVALRRVALRCLVPLVLVVVTVLASAACDRRPASVKAQERLVELRFEQKGLLDELYQRYGQGELASAVQDEAERNERELSEADSAKEERAEKTSAEIDGAKGKRIAKELLRAVGSAAVEVDRAAFDSHCTVAGGGERPSILSQKGKAFFSREDVLETCKKVAKLGIEIDAQEAEIARLRARETED